MTKITLAVVTWNDEKIIRRFMEHHRPHFDEIVWADDHSSDNTVEIAKPYADKSIISPKREYCCEFYRQKLADLSSNDWVLMLDSDQFVDFSVVDKLREYAETADKNGIPYYDFELETIAHKECEACPKETWRQIKFFNRKHIRWSIFPHCGALTIEDSRQVSVGPILGKLWHMMKNCGEDSRQHKIEHVIRMQRWMDVCRYYTRTYTDAAHSVDRYCCKYVFDQLKIDLEHSDYMCSKDPKQLIWIEDDKELEEHLRKRGVL